MIINRKKYPAFGAAVAFVAIAALIVIYLKLGAATGMLLQCPIHYFTGFSCPGCGSQRALLCLLDFRLLDAIKSNYILLPALLYLCLLGAGYQIPKLRGLYSALTRPGVIYLIVGIIVGWTIIRNMLGI